MSKELPAEYLLVAYRLEGIAKDRLQISWRCRIGDQTRVLR